MNKAADTALEILRDIANEARSKDGSMVLHSIANTLEQEINDLHRQLADMPEKRSVVYWGASIDFA